MAINLRRRFFGLCTHRHRSWKAIPALQGTERPLHPRAPGRHLRPGGQKRRRQDHPHPPDLRPASAHRRAICHLWHPPHRPRHHHRPPPDGRRGGDAVHLSRSQRRGKSQDAVPHPGTSLLFRHPRAPQAGGAFGHGTEKGKKLLPGHAPAAGHCRGTGGRSRLSGAGRAGQRPRSPGHH